MRREQIKKKEKKKSKSRGKKYMRKARFGDKIEWDIQLQCV